MAAHLAAPAAALPISDEEDRAAEMPAEPMLRNARLRKVLAGLAIKLLGWLREGEAGYCKDSYCDYR